MERKQGTIYCLCYFTIIFTLFHSTNQLALFCVISLLNKKIRSLLRAPDAVAQMTQWVIRSCPEDYVCPSTRQFPLVDYLATLRVQSIESIDVYIASAI